MNYTCHNTLDYSNAGKYIIKIPRFGLSTPREWIIFVDLGQKVIVGQNIITGQPMYKRMDRVLKDDNRAKIIWQANFVGSFTVSNCTTVMNIITVHFFHSSPTKT